MLWFNRTNDIQARALLRPGTSFGLTDLQFAVIEPLTDGLHLFADNQAFRIPTRPRQRLLLIETPRSCSNRGQGPRGNDLSAEFSEELDPGIALRPRRSWIFRLIVAIVCLAIFAGAAAYLLLNYGHLLDTAPAAQLPISVNVEETVSLEDFRSFQQDLAAKLEALRLATADQQTDLRRLADQVSTLAAKVDNLQNAAVAAPAPALALVRPPVVAMSKKPAAKRKPASTISVGGAPLPPQTRQ